MKSRLFVPFFVLAGLILLVGLACDATTPTAQPPIQVQPTQPPIQVQPTQPPPIQIQPTQPPTVQIQPTEPPPTEAPAEAPDYFTEEFDGLIPDWTYFLMSGDENKMTLESGNGILLFNLTGEDLYVYLLYDPYTYTDVRIDARVENRGFNTNEVSLICRYDPDYGWYEFAIGNDGLYTIYAYDGTTQQYETLFSGGSTAIHSGKDVNEYTAICKGNTLALYINGVEARTITEKRFGFRDGQVGISTSSFDVLPIIVEWDWVIISEP
jgi:hypothetical protein